jgi:hypothetical protein
MASHSDSGSKSDTSFSFEFGNECSTTTCSSVGSTQSSSESITSRPSSLQFCQCSASIEDSMPDSIAEALPDSVEEPLPDSIEVPQPDSDDEPMIECFSCAQFYEPGYRCSMMCVIDIE